MPLSGAAGSLERLPEGQERIGPFRLIAKIGSGRRTTAYLALSEDPRDPKGSLWTLRKLHPDCSREAFLQELKTNNGVLVGQHTHMHELEGALWTQSPAVIGESLQTILDRTLERRQPLNLDIALAIGMSAARALAKLQGRPHGDLVPHHVLLSYDGEIHLIDPAGAAYKSRTLAPDRAGYRSPEHIEGAPLQPASDVFTLGILMFELTCARRLFAEGTAEGIAQQILSGNLPRPRDIVGDGYPIELQLILRKLLRPQSAGRFQDGASAHDALRLVANTRTPVSPTQLGNWLKTQFSDHYQQWTEVTAQAAQPTAVQKEVNALRDIVQQHTETIPDGATEPAALLLQAHELDTMEEKLDQLLGFNTPPPLPTQGPPDRSKTRPLDALPRAQTELDHAPSKPPALRKSRAAPERLETVREQVPNLLEPEESAIPTRLDEIEETPAQSSDVSIDSDWGSLTPFSIPSLGADPAPPQISGAGASPPARESKPLPRADSFEIDEGEVLEEVEADVLEELDILEDILEVEELPAPQPSKPSSPAKPPKSGLKVPEFKSSPKTPNFKSSPKAPEFKSEPKVPEFKSSPKAPSFKSTPKAPAPSPV